MSTDRSYGFTTGQLNPVVGFGGNPTVGFDLGDLGNIFGAIGKGAAAVRQVEQGAAAKKSPPKQAPASFQKIYDDLIS